MRRLRPVLVFIALLAFSATARALEPDEILLLINGRAVESRKLAEDYIRARGVPTANILPLDVPPQEEIPETAYLKDIADPVRTYLQQHDPDHKIKCLLTFYGLPIRVGNRVATPDEEAELKKVRAESTATEAAIIPLVRDLETMAHELDPDYKPPGDQNLLPVLMVRADRAVEQILRRVNVEPKKDVRRAELERLFDDIDPLTGPAGHLQRLMFADLPFPATAPSTSPAGAPVTQPTRREALMAHQQLIHDVEAQVTELAKHPDDPAAREKLRNLSRDQMGLFAYAKILDAHIAKLDPSETCASVDNELALVLWGDDYPLYRWIDNPMYFRNTQRMAGAPPVMMVMRLDAPEAIEVHEIINASVQTEKSGLGGKVVIDSRNIPAHKADGSVDAYGEYDQTLRNLNDLLHEKTKLDIVFDDRPEVLPPGSVRDVGLYVGWYAVRNYMASCQFRPGAVGYHVASLEMVSLRSAGERGWVAGLLNDGISATLGAVAEPYLHSFPKADEFFPLLLTGKLTLAEVYWRTTPLVSWQISMIGDPLYTPFKTNPALKPEDLPDDLQQALNAHPTSTTTVVGDRRVPAPASQP